MERVGQGSPLHANVNASYDISKWLTFGVSVNGSVRNQRAPGTLDRTADPVSGEYSRDFDINPFSYALNTSRTMSLTRRIS